MAEKQAYVCKLPPELIKKAEKELNEKAKTRSKDIQKLREIILKQKDMHIRTDDAYLLRFLRARKCDIERSYQLIRNHFQMKIDDKEIYQGLRPSSVKHIFEGGALGVLPHRDKEGRRIIVDIPGNFDPASYPMEDIVRSYFIILSKIIEEEETQINGVITIVDLKDFTFAHATCASPYFVKRVLNVLQDAFPARLKGIHILNEPTIFDVVYAIAKQFMKQKTIDIMHFHGNKIEELTKFVDIDCLPEEFGGTLGKYSPKEWTDTLCKCDNQFDEESKYGILDGSENMTDGSGVDAMSGIMGSYKKLSVD